MNELLNGIGNENINVQKLKTKDKIKEDFVISLNSINQNKYYEFNKICETIQEHFLSPSKLILNDNEIEINTPRDLVSKGLELVKKVHLSRDIKD